MTISRINGSIWINSGRSNVFPQIFIRRNVNDNIISPSNSNDVSMMKRCDPRGNISRSAYNGSTEGTKIRSIIIYIIGSNVFRIIFLSIFPFSISANSGDRISMTTSGNNSVKRVRSAIIKYSNTIIIRSDSNMIA